MSTHRGGGAGLVAERSHGASRGRVWLPWAISALVHAVVITVGFFAVWTVGPSGAQERTEIVVSFDNPGPAPLAAVSAPVRSEEAARPTGANVALAPIPAGGPVEPVAVARRAAEEAAGAAARISDPLAAPAREVQEQRRLPEVRFAGLGASNAQDIVYVVDASGSMISMFPVVLEYVQRSVSRLARTQRFQVIFYGPEEYVAAPHPGDVQEGLRATRLVRATPENIQTVMAWARGIMPGGRSNPVRALQTALSLQPQAIFVLSNSVTGLGQWEVDKGTLLKQIDQMNPADAKGLRATVIKTIQFLDEDPEGVLKKIGEIHGGEDGYRFIPREEAKAR